MEKGMEKIQIKALFDIALGLRLEWRFTFQQYNSLKQTTKETYK